MEIFWIVAFAVGLILVVVILAAALRSMRPKLPAPQRYTPNPTMPRSAPAKSNAAGAYSSITPSRSSLPAPIAAQIDQLVASGNTIAAIQVLRRHTNLGLKDAKHVIDSWAPAAGADKIVTNGGGRMDAARRRSPHV